jgi:superfamily II DNA/RNA helicase
MIDSFTAFDLDPPLQLAIANAGWHAPTPVQAHVIPAVLAGRDLMASAATGSGKTAAFLLPILQRLSAEPASADGIRALILVPTRELARQIRADFLSLGSRTRLTAAVIIGGEDRGRQVAALRKNPDLVIATPGRMREHLESGEADLTALAFLVLDEADRMLDLGFAPEVIHLIAASNPERQSLLFSATLDQRRLAPLTDHLLREPLMIGIDPVRAPHADIAHQLVLSDDLPHKQAQLLWLLRNESDAKALVFANTRARAETIAAFLVGEGIRAAALHGELDQRERRRVIALLERGEIAVLVASDVAARGLDLAGVERVINLEVPRSGQDYLHRTGRTGRAGQPGIAITLVSGPEWNKMESILRWLRLEIETRQLPGLEARFSGPRRGRKPKGPSHGSRGPGHAKQPQPKQSTKRPKQRLRDRKNIGKRRKPSDAGFQPPRRRPRDD